MAAEIDAELSGGDAAAASNGQQQQQQQQKAGEQQQQEGQQPAAPPQYVELKCYKIPSHARAEASIYSQKHPRWWVQSFLAGVPHLALGGRDDAGVLRRVRTVSVQALPELSARAGQPWDANALLRFGDECLAWVRARCAAAGAGAQLRFEHDPARGGIVCRRLDGGGGGGEQAATMRARLERLLGDEWASGGGGGGKEEKEGGKPAAAAAAKAGGGGEA